MKLKHLFFALAGALLTLVACQEEEDLGVARIELAPNTLTFGSSVSSLDISLTATRPWTAQDVPDWIALDPSSGPASTKPQAVSVTVMADPGYNREADVTLTIGLSKQYLHVYQSGDKGELDKGDGSKERPYTASAAFEYVSSLPADRASSLMSVRPMRPAVTMGMLLSISQMTGLLLVHSSMFSKPIISAIRNGLPEKTM